LSAISREGKGEEGGLFGGYAPAPPLFWVPPSARGWLVAAPVCSSLMADSCEWSVCMAVEFRLPDLGEGIAEAEMVRWLVKPGDRVVLDQAIAEVQTDKAVVELPAPVAGTILSLNVAEGQVVPVETLLVTIEDAAQEAVPVAPAATEPATSRAAVA